MRLPLLPTFQTSRHRHVDFVLVTPRNDVFVEFFVFGCFIAKIEVMAVEQSVLCRVGSIGNVIDVSIPVPVEGEYVARIIWFLRQPMQFDFHKSPFYNGNGLDKPLKRILVLQARTAFYFVCESFKFLPADVQHP